MSQTEATEILRAMFYRVSRKIPAKWVTPDVVSGAVVETERANGRVWSKTRDVTVCRHMEWKDICGTCDRITKYVEGGSSYEDARAKTG